MKRLHGMFAKSIEDVSSLLKQLHSNGITKIFIFTISDEHSYFITFNVEEGSEIIKDSIIIHRKPETNSFYTINALNKLIEKDGTVDWEKYKNKLLMIDKLKKDLIMQNLELIEINKN